MVREREREGGEGRERERESCIIFIMEICNKIFLYKLISDIFVHLLYYFPLKNKSFSI